MKRLNPLSSFRSIRSIRSTRSIRPILFLSASLLVAAGAAVACGSDEPDSTFVPAVGDADVDPLQGLTAIRISPESATLQAGDAPTTANFTAEGTFADGSRRDVSALVDWSAVPNSLLAWNGTTVTPVGPIGGDGELRAASTTGTVTASVPIHVTLKQTILANGAPADAEAQFAAPVDAAFSPEVVYPLDGVLVPPNLAPMDIQWRAPDGATLFDLKLSSATVDIHIYTPCTPVSAPTQCSFTPTQTVWNSLTQTLGGFDAVSLTIRAVGGTPAKVGESKPAAIQFASTPVQGGLYYFNTKDTSAGDGGAKPGIYRYDFETKNTGEFFTQQQCAGCHALSKDGTKMLAPICTNERGCGRPMQLAVVDVATKTFVTPPMPVGDSDTQAWSPDNRYYVTTPSCGTYAATAPFACADYSGGTMNLIDATTNTLVGKIPANPGALFPSFSNAGKRLVYARGATYGGPLSISGSSLYGLDFTAGSPPTWGAEVELLKSQGENNYYPSYSPDDAWIVFSRSQCEAGDPGAACDSYDDPSARVFVIPAAGGTPIELGNANGTKAGSPSPKLDNSWPKWSPFKGSYKGGDLLWLTFSTVRDYGFRTPTEGGSHVRQLWLVGFDLARARAGLDPSFAPVWLPFQETTTSNHIGQWTEKIIEVK